MCSPEQRRWCPGNSQHSHGQTRRVNRSEHGLLLSWSSQGRPKAKGSTPVYPKQLPAPFPCKQEILMKANASLCNTRNVCSLPTGHTPTLNVLREFFISATFSSMAQRQLLTFSSRAYSPCWIRDSSCIASVKPAFSSEASACNYSNHTHGGFSPSSQAQVFVFPRVTKAGWNPSCKVLSSFCSSFHCWEIWGEVWPLLQPQYRVGGVCLGQSICPIFRLFLKTFLSFSRLPGSLQPVSL